jgi:hypothetical protein
MSEENVESYKRAVEASNRHDLEALLEELDPEVEWCPQVVGLGSEVYRGAEGIHELFGDIDETMPDAFSRSLKSATSATASFPLAPPRPRHGERRSDRSPVQPADPLQGRQGDRPSHVPRP